MHRGDSIGNHLPVFLAHASKYLLYRLLRLIGHETAYIKFPGVNAALIDA